MLLARPPGAGDFSSIPRAVSLEEERDQGLLLPGDPSGRGATTQVPAQVPQPRREGSGSWFILMGSRSKQVKTQLTPAILAEKSMHLLPSVISPTMLPQSPLGRRCLERVNGFLCRRQELTPLSSAQTGSYQGFQNINLIRYF